MTNFQSRICFGFAPAMLFPKSFEDPYQHFAAIQTCCTIHHMKVLKHFFQKMKA